MNFRRTLYSVLALCAVLAVILNAEVINGALTILGTLTANGIVDFSAATSTKPSKSGTTPPATCSVGEEFFDTDAAAGANKLLCTSANVWTAISGGGGTITARDNLRDTSGTLDFDPTDVSTVWEYDDFRWGTLAATSVTNGRMNWSIAAIGTSTAALAFQSQTWPNLGVLRVTTGSVAAGNGNGMSPISASTGYNFALGNNTDKVWKYVYVFRVGQTSGQRFFAGLSGASNAVVTNGFGLRHDTNASALCGAADTTNFTFISAASSGPSNGCYDTGVAVDTNFHTLVIRSDGATSQKIWFSLDGGTERSVCPSGCSFTATPTTSALAPVAYVVNDDVSTRTVYLELDHYSSAARVSTAKGDRNP